MAVRSLNRTAQVYSHERWRTRRRFLRFLLRTVGQLLFRVDRVEGLENFPAHGSAVLMINHIAFVDPIVVVHVSPRQIVPLAKIEVYEYPLVGFIPRMWGVIPVHRGKMDRKAVRTALEVLDAGEIILVAPEGTRNDALQRGLEGVSYLASRGQAHVVPVAVEHTVGFPSFPLLPRWRKPGAHIRFGKPFRFKPEIRRPGREQLRKMTDEAMYQLAAMLPESRRGVYGDLTAATQETIELL